MVQVTELGYIGIGVKDLETWQHFASDIIGWQIIDEGEPDRCYARMDYWHHRIVLHSDPSDDLLYLGFRVAGPEEFQEMQVQLADAGISDSKPVHASKTILFLVLTAPYTRGIDSCEILH